MTLLPIKLSALVANILPALLWQPPSSPALLVSRSQIFKITYFMYMGVLPTENLEDQSVRLTTEPSL